MTMKNFTSALLVLALWLLMIVAANASGIGGSSGVGGLPSSPTFSGSVKSSKPCAFGYHRLTPNYCAANNATAELSWTDVTACTARVFSSTNPLPSDAVAGMVKIQWQIRASSAVGGPRNNSVFFYPNNTCILSSWNATSRASSYEFVAASAGTDIGYMTETLIVEAVGVNTFYFTQTNAGGNGNADITTYKTVGYFD